MARLWKVLKIGALVVVSLLVLVVATVGGWVYYTLQPFEINPSAYDWEKGIDETEVERLAAELLAKMTLEEKIEQMSGDGVARFLLGMVLKGHVLVSYSGANERLGIPPVAFTDGPRGVIVGRSTSFPVAIARAASWDTDLERRVGDAIGKEARALGANYFGGVCINLVRHPSMGRAQESYGEDPWLMGEMAVSLVKAVQHHNVMACAKHFALNSMETSRFGVNVELDDRTLQEVYLPHFRKSIEADVASIMSAYNKFRGEYCGHSRELLTEILREDMGFKGFVTSDWFYGLRDGLKGVKAGMDIEMPGANYYGDNLKGLVESGAVTEAEIDEIVLRILRTKLYYITREDPMEYGEGLVASPDHTALAREAAEEGMVLLKNEGGILPLDRSRTGTVAVVGHLADADNTGDKGSSSVNPPYLVSPLQGIREYLNGSAEVLHADGSDLSAVRDAAERADVVIVVAGIRNDEEGEFINADGSKPNSPEEKIPLTIGDVTLSGGDRVPLSLEQRDLDVIDSVTAVNSNCVVVMIGGSVITLEEWQEKAPAILMAWYIGMEGGNALARVLYGEVNPSGKLPLTFPVDESQLPPFDEFAETAEYGYYHGYTLIDKQGYEPSYPFGFGLSYTQYEYSNLVVETPEVSADGTVRVHVDIRNAGEVAGKETVQLYVSFENAVIDRPVKLLRDFEKVYLGVGETRTVELSVEVKELAWYNPETRGWEVEPVTHSVLVGPSSRVSDLLRGEFTIFE